MMDQSETGLGNLAEDKIQVLSRPTEASKEIVSFRMVALAVIAGKGDGMAPTSLMGGYSRIIAKQSESSSFFFREVLAMFKIWKGHNCRGGGSVVYLCVSAAMRFESQGCGHLDT